MKYINAADVLPKELLNEILNYVDGELLYIPASRKNESGEKIVVQENIIRNVIVK
ncbi:hypothetical protein [Clostridium beijerinckii]|uniref:hypothetical protein n=1 Tax=Clostridium beijerinckii TaxID=1520 RepID=UPI0017F1EF94|nr:hypothetical protein [Clostridium beijerinckii]NRZ93782.1 hypothetical protein [Clostridium beijerinckii]NYC12691.1 hypothetical protein [Clostridium beijerinckii]